MYIFVDDNKINITENMTIEQLCKKNIYENSETAMMAVVNNSVVPLNTMLKEGDNTRIITISETEGHRVYKRSLVFLFMKVVSELYPEVEVEVCHTINRGELCKFKNIDMEDVDVQEIKLRMFDLVKKDLKFKKIETNVDNIKGIESQQKRLSLFETINKEICTVYELDGYYDYVGGILVPSTGYLKLFELIELVNNGILILCPKKSNPSQIEKFYFQPHLMAAFDQVENWAKIHNIHYLDDLNEKILKNEYSEMIQICEALHEHCFSDIGAAIKKKNAKMIFVTGPSSSGKTTSANRTRIQLMVQGSNPLILSMDDYFIDRDKMEREPDGSLDFEHIKVVDLEEFKNQATALLRGEAVHLRRFDFKTGTGFYDSKATTLPEGSEIIVEGIHAFNPKVQNLFADYICYKICVNPLSYINIDDHNRISSTDCRKIRRMVRDMKHRNISAEKTLEMWPSIRKGEEENIFPYLETADIILNTTLAYELSVLKKYAEKALTEVDVNSKNYIEVKRLLALLANVVSLDDETDIPKTSILQEFLK